MAAALAWADFLIPPAQRGAEIWLLLSEAGLALGTVSSQCVHSCWGHGHLLWGPASSHPGPWTTQSPWGCPYSLWSTLFSHSGLWPQGLAVSPPCCVRASCPSPTSTGTGGSLRLSDPVTWGTTIPSSPGGAESPPPSPTTAPLRPPLPPRTP